MASHKIRTIHGKVWLLVSTYFLRDSGIREKCNALNAQAWEITTSQKLKQFLWQIVSGSLIVTSGLTQRVIYCENIKRCKMMEVTINHGLFECLNSHQTRTLSLIPMKLGHYLLWRLSHSLDEHVNYNFFHVFYGFFVKLGITRCSKKPYRNLETSWIRQ